MVAIAKDPVRRVEELWLVLYDVPDGKGQQFEMMGMVIRNQLPTPLWTADKKQLGVIVADAEAMKQLGMLCSYKVIHMSGRRDVTDEAMAAYRDHVLSQQPKKSA